MSSEDEKSMKKAVNKTAKGGKKEEPVKKEAPKKGKKKHDESDDEDVPQKVQQLSDDEEDTKKGKKAAKSAPKKEEPVKKEAPKKGKKKHGDSDDEDDQPKHVPAKQQQQSDDEDEDDHKKGKKAAKSAPKKEEPVKKEAPKKGGKKRQDDSDEDEKPAQKGAASDDEDEGDHKKGKKSAKTAPKKEEPVKKEAPKKGKKKHGDSDDEDEQPKQAPVKEEPAKKEAPKKGGKKRQDDSEDEQKPVAKNDQNDDDEDSKPKGGHKKAPVAGKAPFKKNEAPKKGAPKKKQDSDDEDDKEEGEGDEFKVAQHSSKKANEKAKKELVQQKKLQQATGKSAPSAATKKASNNQFAAAASSDDDSEENSDSEEEVKPTKKAAEQQKGGDKKNIFAVSGSEEEESEEESSEEEVDEEELERERLKKEEEERKKKEEFERKRQEEEDRKKAAAEKKRLQQEAKKKQEEEEMAALMSAVTANKKTESKPKEEKEKVEGEEDEEEGEGEEGGEKKLSKAQQKKLKEKQKKDALASGQVPEAPAATNDKDKKKKGPALSKVAQAALEKQAKLQKEKEEKDRLEAEEKKREEEEARKEAEEKKKKDEEKLKAKELKKQMKKDGTLKTKEQLKKEEEERIKRQALLEQFGVAPKLEEVKSISSEAAKAPVQKKKVKKDIFGQVIKEEEKVEEKVETMVLELDGDDWEAMMEPTPVEAPKEEVKAPVFEEQKSSETSSQAEESKDKKKALTKKELADLEKAEKEASKAARNEKIAQGQKKNKKVEEKKDVLRSPIVCILGHVDTGKTTLLDKLRRTNVQAGEAGGITQQIGATYFPGENVIAETNKCQDFYPVEVKAPGLLVIDTPGHESFSNLRTRGSSLCDFAILVIDLMHGLEQQTLESLNLLKMRKTPFVIALNKIDRTYDWKTNEFGSSYTSFKAQTKENQNDFNHRYQQIITQLAENSFNADLYWNNPDPKTYFPIVPTSGVTGEGIPDLLSVIIKYTSMYMKSRMVVKEDEFNCTVMEVKKIDGLGVTIDAILVDGTIRKDDKIVLLGFNGPIKTKIRALLTPHPMKEMRVKGEYEHHDIIHASMGIKISAPDLENVVAGSQLYLGNTEDEEQTAIDLIMNDFDSVKKKVKLMDQGVGVAASTLGSLEALLNFLDKSKIPVSYVSVGPVSKEDITKALKSVLADDVSKRRQEYACMLVFDVKVLPDAQKYAEDNGVKIFTANIIYHLFDFFMKYVKECEEARKREEGKHAIFPCLIKPLQFFNKADPIIMGVDIERGVLKPGTPVCLYNATKLKIGVVESIESNKKSVPFARKETGSVAIRISGTGNLMAGRQFTEKDLLVSILSRKSIDALKDHYRDEVTKDEWLFIKEKLKPFFNIL